MDIVFGYTASRGCFSINFAGSYINAESYHKEENLPFLTFTLDGDQLLDLKALIDKKLTELV